MTRRKLTADIKPALNVIRKKWAALPNIETISSIAPCFSQGSFH